jgi:hypothetical protein
VIARSQKWLPGFDPEQDFFATTCSPHPLTQHIPGLIPRRYSDRNVKLVAQLQLVPRFGMC